VRISRMATGVAATQTLYAAPPMPPAVVAAVAAAPAASPAAVAPPPSVDHLVQAPMVGTYYSAPAPGAKAFVQMGDEVKVGQVLCIIEAMKMMNQIESDRAGKVTSVLVQNGDPVEFGQPLFAIQ